MGMITLTMSDGKQHFLKADFEIYKSKNFEIKIQIKYKNTINLIKSINFIHWSKKIRYFKLTNKTGHVKNTDIIKEYMKVKDIYYLKVSSIEIDKVNIIALTFKGTKQ